MELFDSSFDFAKDLLESSGGALELLPPPVRTVFVAGTAQAIIDNGGLEYFFESDFPGQPAYEIFADAYQRIEAEECAEAIRRAVGLLPFSAPHLREGDRCEQLDPWNSMPQSPLDACNEIRIGSSKVWALLERHLEDHRDEFPRS